jgi:hypothetical protein
VAGRPQNRQRATHRSKTRSQVFQNDYNKGGKKRTLNSSMLDSLNSKYFSYFFLFCFFGVEQKKFRQFPPLGNNDCQQHDFILFFSYFQLCFLMPFEIKKREKTSPKRNNNNNQNGFG